jgi:hypothetical protein
MPPPPRIYELLTVNEQKMCPLYFLQYLPLKLSTHTCISSATILLFLFTLHFYILLLLSLLSQLYSLLKLLVVFQCLLSIIVIR